MISECESGESSEEEENEPRDTFGASEGNCINLCHVTLWTVVMVHMFIYGDIVTYISFLPDSLSDEEIERISDSLSGLSGKELERGIISDARRKEMTEELKGFDRVPTETAIKIRYEEKRQVLER